MQKFTRQQFDAMFPDDDACLEWLKNYLYPDGIFCAKCDRVTKHHRVATRRSYSCQHCGNHVHPTADTIYHKSSTSLRIWFQAIYLMAQTRCGISAKQLERETGVTYKTAWRMFKQIRSMLNDDEPLSGHVEADETYCGGKRPGKRGRGAAGKTIVAGAVERKGRVIVKVVPDTTSSTLNSFVKAYVLPSSTVYTDELASYNPLKSHGYEHKRIHHAAKVYVDGDTHTNVDGDTHTNSIEGFWSLLKRGFGGVYHAVGSHYLQTYANEYAFRYNRRDDEMPMFLSVMTQVQKRAD
jgi:transposase-like protein